MTPPDLIKLAERLEDFAEKGVFTAEHRWQSVVDAAAALRAVASEVASADTSQIQAPQGE